MSDSPEILDVETREFLSSMDAKSSHDRYFKRLGIAGWSMATVAIIAFGIVSLQKFVSYWRFASDSPIGKREALNELVPFLGALAGVGILIALFAGVALMMRARSASLKQISQRLSVLEDLIVRSSDDQRTP
jgi:hypothetical protein